MIQLRVDADLSFSVTRATEGRHGHDLVRGSVRSEGTHITVAVDDVLALSAAGQGRAAIATGLAERGLTLTLSGPRGPVATLGAVRSRWWHRVLTGSRHIRVDDWRMAWRLRRAQRLRLAPAATAAAVPPPPTPFPLAPTFRRRRRPVSTTHDPFGGGRPQLVLAMGPAPTRDDKVKTFRLAPGVTTIGSAVDADLRLDGLAPRHAEVRRDDADEYVLVPVARGVVTLVNGVEADRHVLRTGARIQLGGWKMSYWREEFADHGRPFGGRQGGELSRQRPQDRPVYRTPERPR